MRRSTFFLGLATTLTLIFGCQDRINAGEPCFESVECEGGAICVSTAVPSGSGGSAGSGGSGGAGGAGETDKFCMLECSKDVIRCENDQEACVQSEDPSIYVCLSGGNRVVGAVCETSFECTVGSVCVAFAEGLICRPICDPELTGLCPLGLDCLAFDGDESRGYCDVPARGQLDPGDPCSQSAECEGNALCVSTGSGGTGGAGGSTGEKLCMLECSEGLILCEDGEACVESEDPSAYVCLSGGGTSLNGTCETSFDCRVGLICVDRSPESTCAFPCDPASSDVCPIGTCTPLESGDSPGYCEIS